MGDLTDSHFTSQGEANCTVLNCIVLNAAFLPLCFETNVGVKESRSIPQIKHPSTSHLTSSLARAHFDCRNAIPHFRRMSKHRGHNGMLSLFSLLLPKEKRIPIGGVDGF